MTDQPHSGYQQQPVQGFAPPSGSGPHQGQPPAGAYWPPPPPPPGRRRRPVLIAIILAVLAAAGGVVTIVLTTSGGTTSRLTGGPGSSLAEAPGPGSSASGPSSGIAPSSARPLPPPTPTGRPHDNDDPQQGDCVDFARRPTGIVIYQANCDDPAAALILESTLPENTKCPGKGFFGLKSLSKESMCFTHNLQVGDCVESIKVPRRTTCAGPTSPGGTSVVTVTEIRRGQQDGTGCTDPERILQVGKDAERGVACLAADAKPTTPPQPSR